MVKTPPMVIFFHRGEVSVYVVLLFRRGSSSTILPSAKSSLEPPAIFLSLLSSYLAFLLSFL
jgi:hypothetical protein